MPSPISKRYAKLLATEIVRRRPSPGTIPADVRVITAVLQARFADKKFLQNLVNDVIAKQRVSLKVG